MELAEKYEYLNHSVTKSGRFQNSIQLLLTALTSKKIEPLTPDTIQTKDLSILINFSLVKIVFSSEGSKVSSRKTASFIDAMVIYLMLLALAPSCFTYFLLLILALGSRSLHLTQPDCLQASTSV